MDTTAIVVKAGKLPGVLTDVALGGNATVADALSQAGLDATGFEVRVNGESASGDRRLSDGDTVLLTRQIKGNQVLVKVGKLPGVLSDIALNDGATVETALSTANLDATGFEVRVNGESATGSTRIADGDTVLLTRQIKGN